MRTYHLAILLGSLLVCKLQAAGQEAFLANALRIGNHNVSTMMLAPASGGQFVATNVACGSSQEGLLRFNGRIGETQAYAKMIEQYKVYLVGKWSGVIPHCFVREPDDFGVSKTIEIDTLGNVLGLRGRVKVEVKGINTITKERAPAILVISRWDGEKWDICQEGIELKSGYLIFLQPNGEVVNRMRKIQ